MPTETHCTPERMAGAAVPPLPGCPHGHEVASLGRRRGARAGFTLIELLVVVALIGLLASIVVLVGSRVMHAQKVNYTKTIMSTVTMAIEQFAVENPLRTTYDRRNAATFGPYPPYMLATPGAQSPQPNTVAGTIEPYSQYSPGGSFSYVLADRLHRDLNGRQGSVNDWVQVRAGSGDPNEGNDDIRALYTYLKIYSPGAAGQIPDDAIRPIPAPGKVDMVYVRGNRDPNGAVDVLGIHDAWGVPLDYFLYVKLDWDGDRWQVTDRVPLLRSRGVTLEEYQAELRGADEPDPEKWIISEPFPAPAACQQNPSVYTQLRITGVLPAGAAELSGWVRAPGPGDFDPNSFGFVP